MTPYISDADSEPPTPDEIAEWEASDVQDELYEVGFYNESGDA